MRALTKFRRWYQRYRASQISWEGRDLAALDCAWASFELGGLHVRRNADDQIDSVRIGAWRVLNSSKTRQIVGVRQLEEQQRIAVQIELADPFSLNPITTVWEIYDLQGHMESMLQSTDDSALWIETRSGTSPSGLARS